MKYSKLQPKDYQIFMFKSSLWLIMAWSGFALTLTDIFYASVVWLMVFIIGIWMTIKMKKNMVPIKPTKEMLFAGIILAIIAFSFASLSQPTVFTGRDQGSFSEAAIRLSQNHKLEFSTPASKEFFKLHEPGKALNFPGFYFKENGQLTTQFSLVYISWLALFYTVFGINGFIVANGVLLTMFLLSFYLLIRLFVGVSSTIATMAFTTTSFVFMWFAKYTLSENIALSIAWISILSLMLLLKKQRRLFYYVFLLSSFLLCFARIEGLALLVVSVIILSLKKEVRKFVKEKMLTRFFLPAIILITTFILNIMADRYFYKEIIKAILPTITLPKASYIGQIKNNILPSFYTAKIFYIYGMLGFFIVGSIGIIKSFWKKEFYSLIPLFVVLPTAVYLLDSQISPDHPWMLRRFMFSLFPGALFYSGIFLGQLFENKLANKKGYAQKIFSTTMFLILIVSNLPAFLKYLTFSENKDLLKQTQLIGEKFSPSDLVLIDKGAAGDGWAMISGPMSSIYGKNSAYFFNTQDISKIDTDKFENIYLISPNDQVPFYLNSTIGNRLSKTDDYTISTTKLDIKPANVLEKISLPEKKNITINGKIFRIEK